MNSRPTPIFSIDQIRSYLQAKNWTRDGEIRALATVWHRNDSEAAEVVLPMSYEVRDVEQRLRDALVSLATHERRDVVQVADDIAGASSNLLTVRVVGEDTMDGNIPIEDGVLLIRKAKELLYAAAMAVYSKRQMFSGLPPKDAKNYMDSLLLGQTEIGSYVVKVLAPSNTPPLSLDEPGVATTLTSSVSHSLVTGLAALSEASNRYEKSGNPEVFADAVANGASANMCDALVGFSGKHQNRTFEIKVTTPSSPLFMGEARAFSFDSRDVQALQAASSFYKNDYVLVDREIIGSVTNLHRPRGDEFGTITVQAIVGETERSVRIQLAPDDYHLGVLAHDEKKSVRCLGDVHVKSRTTTLLNPRGFQIIDFRPLF